MTFTAQAYALTTSRTTISFQWDDDDPLVRA
jgi:hypothetical protein